MHDLKDEAAEVVKHGLHVIGIMDNNVTDTKVDFKKGESSYYSYMTLPVPENFDLTTYESLGGG
jgi:hypothetical protein